MAKRTTIWIATIFSAGSWFAQAGATTGIYQITSGKYIECCGIAGNILYSLPYDRQAFIHLKVDSDLKVAEMSILGNDMRTVFRAYQWTNTFPFTFTNGIVFADHIQFQERWPPPPPAPGQPAVSYTATNSANALRVDGIVIQQYMCCDIPNQFRHTNVVATLVQSTSRPRLSKPFMSTNGLVSFVVSDGAAGETNVIEASSNLSQWAAISTNVFPPTLCPTCPFIQFEDSSSTNFQRRFYRAFILR